MFAQSVFGSAPLGATAASRGTSQPGTIWQTGAQQLPPGCSVDVAQGRVVCPQGPAPVYDRRIALPVAPAALPRQAQYTMPVGPSAAQPLPWLWVGLGVLVIGGAGYWYYTKQKHA